MNVPKDLLYTKSHEWVRIEGDVATVGITDHAQSELGDIVYLDLPEVGRILQHDDNFGSVESVKTVSDLYSPVPGEVIEKNETLGAQSELVNSSPYEDGWLIKVKLTDLSATSRLMDAATYEQEISG